DAIREWVHSHTEMHFGCIRISLFGDFPDAEAAYVMAVWHRAWKRPRFRAGSGPWEGVGEWPWRADCVELPGSARQGRRGVGRAGSGDCHVSDAGAPRWRRCRRIIERLGPPPSLGAMAAMLAATRARAWSGCRRRRRTFRTSALENEGQGMDRGREGSAAPQGSEGGLGFPGSLMRCRRDPVAERPRTRT